MATANPTRAMNRAERRALVRQLAADGMSNRAIARRLNIGKDTVARDLAATDEPTAPATTLQNGAPHLTSGASHTLRLLHPLEPALIQDLNVLADPRTGALPAPLRRIIRAAADHRRAKLRAIARRIADEE
ncbi:hypothetical protein [Streptomyces sp. NPDC003299]